MTILLSVKGKHSKTSSAELRILELANLERVEKGISIANTYHLADFFDEVLYASVLHRETLIQLLKILEAENGLFRVLFGEHFRCSLLLRITEPLVEIWIMRVWWYLADQFIDLTRFTHIFILITICVYTSHLMPLRELIDWEAVKCESVSRVFSPPIVDLIVNADGH